MTFEPWLAFAATYALISAIPGRSILLIRAQEIAQGRRTSLLCVAGDVLGGLVLIVLALFGVGANGIPVQRRSSSARLRWRRVPDRRRRADGDDPMTDA